MMLEDVIKVALLSLVEGVTEFLPVSSTGHLIVSKALLDFAAIGPVFEIFIQIGAVVAVIVYYRRTLLSHARQCARSATVRAFWLKVALACAPAGGLGLVLDDGIVSRLFAPIPVAVALIAGGLVFIALERSPRFGRAPDLGESDIIDITWRQAALVGVVQAFALFPGASRSGSSIVGGILAGMRRRDATEFSFFLAIPLLGGATLYKLLSSLGALSGEQIALLALGAALSGIFSWLAIGWLLKFVSRHSFLVFGWYRVVAGGLILLAAAAGLL